MSMSVRVDGLTRGVTHGGVLVFEPLETQHITTSCFAVLPIREWDGLVDDEDAPITRRFSLEICEDVLIDFVSFSHDAYVVGECEGAEEDTITR